MCIFLPNRHLESNESHSTGREAQDQAEEFFFPTLKGDSVYSHRKETFGGFSSFCSTVFQSSVVALWLSIRECSSKRRISRDRNFQS